MRKIQILAGFILVSIIFSGCDQISSFMEYFKPKQSQPKQQAQLQAAVSPSEAQKAKPSRAVNQADVVAQVGDWTMTIDEFYDRLDNLKAVIPQFDANDLDSKKLVLEEIVRQQLLVINAEQSGLADNVDIKEAVEEFRRTLLVREVVMRIARDLRVSEEQAMEFYEEHKAEFIAPAQWHIREIVVDSQDEANSILGDILQGADFAQTAQEKSKSESAQQGGDVGVIENAPFPQMQNVLMTLETGGVSGVFKGPKGFYIIKLEEKEGGEQKEFSEIKDEVVEGLTLMKQQQAILDYINQLQQKIPVSVNEELLSK